MNNLISINLRNNHNGSCIICLEDFKEANSNKKYMFDFEDIDLNFLKGRFKFKNELGIYEHSEISSISEIPTVNSEFKHYEFWFKNILIDIKFNINKFIEIYAVRDNESVPGDIIMSLPIKCIDADENQENSVDNKDQFNIIYVPMNTAYIGILHPSDFGFDNAKYRFSDVITKMQKISYYNVEMNNIQFNPSYNDGRIANVELKKSNTIFHFFGKIKEVDGNLEIVFVSCTSDNSSSNKNSVYPFNNQFLCNTESYLTLKLCIIER